jgi:NUMOD4 motif
MEEQWRDITGYDGVYQVSDQGQVRNTQTSRHYGFLVRVHSDIFDVITHLSCLLGGKDHSCQRLSFPLR